MFAILYSKHKQSCVAFIALKTTFILILVLLFFTFIEINYLSKRVISKNI